MWQFQELKDHTYTYLSNGDDGFALVYGANPGSPVDPVLVDMLLLILLEIGMVIQVLDGVLLVFQRNTKSYSA